MTRTRGWLVSNKAGSARINVVVLASRRDGSNGHVRHRAATCLHALSARAIPTDDGCTHKRAQQRQFHFVAPSPRLIFSISSAYFLLSPLIFARIASTARVFFDLDAWTNAVGLNAAGAAAVG